ncbi:protein containing Transport-associated domain protein [Rhodopirellula europaea 6C]|uniref:Protein containing Transport-associated domain protein n=2 Tax=Rhodopirellula TaxID=265488 RepID=M2ATK4_9BACT|nr:protein containing Transport-associated domain protein [Rhodopirellula europaea 6C]
MLRQLFPCTRLEEILFKEVGFFAVATHCPDLSWFDSRLFAHHNKIKELPWPESQTSEILLRTEFAQDKPVRAFRVFLKGIGTFMHSTTPSNDIASTVSGAPIGLTDPADLRVSELRATAAIRALADSNVAELRFLRVDESENEICLTGRVRSFYHKQLAQEAIRPIAAGRQVVNRVDVCMTS